MSTVKVAAKLLIPSIERMEPTMFISTFNPSLNYEPTTVCILTTPEGSKHAVSKWSVGKFTHFWQNPETMRFGLTNEPWNLRNGEEVVAIADCTVRELDD